MAGFRGRYPRWCRVGHLRPSDRAWVRNVVFDGWSYRAISAELLKDGIYVSKSAIGRYAQWLRDRAI